MFSINQLSCLKLTTDKKIKRKHYTIYSIKRVIRVKVKVTGAKKGEIPYSAM